MSEQDKRAEEVYSEMGEVEYQQYPPPGYEEVAKTRKGILAAALAQARWEGYREGVEAMQKESKQALLRYSGTYHSVSDAIDEASASLLAQEEADGK